MVPDVIHCWRSIVSVMVPAEVLDSKGRPRQHKCSVHVTGYTHAWRGHMHLWALVRWKASHITSSPPTFTNDPPCGSLGQSPRKPIGGPGSPPCIEACGSPVRSSGLASIEQLQVPMKDP